LAVTGTGQLSSSVVSAHLQTEFLVAAAAQERWDQFTWVPSNGAIVPGSENTATTVEVVIYPNMALATTTIPESTDIEGVELTDTSINVAVGEYANTAQETKLLRALGRTDIPSVFQKLVGVNAGLTQDALARATYIGGPLYRRPTAADTRADLDLVNDDMQAAGYNFMYSLVAQLRTVGCPGIGQASEAIASTQGASEPPTTEYASIVHDLAIGDLQETNGWVPLAYAQSPQVQGLYNGELAKLAGVRFIESPLGKVYQSAGTVAQSATTATLATVGATTITVASATGITAGDYLTLGALETGTTETTTLETVYVTAVSGTTTLTVIGAGAAGGLRYAQAQGVAVTEAAFVAAIPVIGGMSVAKVHSTMTGPKPTMVQSGPFDKLGRFKNYGWYWLGGYGRTIPTWIVRGEVAVNGKAITAYGA
jgi:N4-gp56 family major capsid protein